MIWGHLASSIGDSSLSSPSRFSLRMGMSVSTFVSQNRHVPRLAFAPVPVELPTKSDQGSQKAVRMDAFVSKSCPSLYQPYDPPRWMHKYGLVCFQWLVDKPRFPTVVTSKLRTAWLGISPKSTRLYTTGKLEIMPS